jgi:hypothetical protein
MSTPLLFDLVEQAVRQPFVQFLSQLDANQQLDRVVFDECYLILTVFSGDKSIWSQHLFRTASLAIYSVVM